jgi:hypothetical protein
LIRKNQVNKYVVIFVFFYNLCACALWYYFHELAEFNSLFYLLGKAMRWAARKKKIKREQLTITLHIRICLIIPVWCYKGMK